MFCGKCGAQLPDNAAFCSKCGNAMQPAKSINSQQLSMSKGITLSPKLWKIVMIIVACIVVFGVIVLIKSGISARETDVRDTMMEDTQDITVGDIQERPDDAEMIKEDVKKDMAEDTQNVLQNTFPYGTWTDSTGIVSFTFGMDGSVFIGGLENTLGVSLFTFTEVDDDTIQLSAKTDNVLLGILKVNLDYEISGDTMLVEIADQGYQLKREE